ncbi:hypothetical protein GPECTOR_111g253 [Gonium pectorale]|uniref:Uncharacterized protein n=1 Tax=Gonium pectorale TaxID=33097 RepID=A0A150G0S8_GONPE|nr:hypothetical protein GPECTOR_111g253 [Gonium pectorale]|eukprot:KXZ42920.1 hypothetical protein GPECTOR_111g253 [Gonium pectorale]
MNGPPGSGDGASAVVLPSSGGGGGGGGAGLQPPPGALSMAPSPHATSLPVALQVGPYVPRRDPNNPGDLSYRSVDSDLVEHSEVNYYRNTRILHPWDLASGADVPRPLSMPLIIANASGSFASGSFTYGSGGAGGSGAGGLRERDRDRDREGGRQGGGNRVGFSTPPPGSVSSAALAVSALSAAKRPATEEGYAQLAGVPLAAAAPSYQSRPSPGAEAGPAPGGEGGAAGAASAAAAAFARPGTTGSQARSTALIPNPSSLYGPATAYLAKLPPPKNSPRHSPRISPRTASAGNMAPPAGAVAGATAAAGQGGQPPPPPPLAPHTQAAAAAAAAAAAGAGALPANGRAPSRAASDGVAVLRPYTAPLPAAPSPRLPPEAAPESPPIGCGPSPAQSAWPAQSAAITPTQALTDTTGDGAGSGFGPRPAANGGSISGGPSTGQGLGAGAGGSGPGGLSPSSASVLLLEQQRAGQAVTIEQILMGTVAAPARGYTPAVSRPDAAALQAVQQAFRALNPKAKPASREDVFELQAALLRQVAQLLFAGPEATHAATAASAASPAAAIGLLAPQPSQANGLGRASSPGANGRYPSPRGAAQAALAARSATSGGSISPVPGVVATRQGAISAPPGAQPPPPPPPPTAGAGPRSRAGGTATEAPGEGGGGGGVGSASPRPGPALPGPPPTAVPFSWEDVVYQPLLPRDADGFVCEEALTKQEAALAGAVTGLVAQVGVSCVERAHLLHGVWATSRQLLAAVLQDREAARAQLALVRRDAAAAASNAAAEVEALRRNLSSANVQVDRLAARERENVAELVATRAELIKLRKVVEVGEVESLAAQLAALREAHDAAQRELAGARAQLAELEQELCTGCCWG